MQFWGFSTKPSSCKVCPIPSVLHLLHTSTRNLVGLQLSGTNISACITGSLMPPRTTSSTISEVCWYQGQLVLPAVPEACCHQKLPGQLTSGKTKLLKVDIRTQPIKARAIWHYKNPAILLQQAMKYKKMTLNLIFENDSWPFTVNTSHKEIQESTPKQIEPLKRK